MEYRRLAFANLEISRTAFGCWAIGGHGYGAVDDEESIKAIKKALDFGINFFDTADVYGFGKSEKILRKALGESRHKVVIASKGGVRWDSSGKIRKDCSPNYLRQAVEGSLLRLGLDCIPLYYIHWPDGQTPISEAVGALGRLMQEGKIGSIGLSNFSGPQLEEALTYERIQAVQVRYNILQQTRALELIPICRQNNITLVAWGALGDGLLTGKFTKDTRFGGNDHRRRSPGFQGDRFLNNLLRVENLRTISSSIGVTMGQLALRWVLDSLNFSCVLFGAKTEQQVSENIGAIGWHLTEEDLAAIEKSIFK